MPIAPSKTCIQPTLAQDAVIKVLGTAASFYNKTIGIGVGGAGGAGNIVGTSFGYSRQLIVSPNGQAALEVTVSNLAGYPFNTITAPGAGVFGGLQFSISNAQTPQDLAGPFMNVEGGFGDGLAIYGDGAFGFGTQGQTVYQGTYTVGLGAGGFAGGGSPTSTYVVPIC